MGRHRLQERHDRARRKPRNRRRGRPPESDVPGFHVVKRRWVVERSLGWIMQRRRLARDYETLPTSSEAMIHIASIDNLTKRITDETTPTWRGTY
ncbi:transposase (plasmid) [Streptomyces viridifaciens]|nr:transposase [Streptomyces viridifaciens]UKZ03815.1 transposase [Streptomyces viridifaciens]